MVTTRRPALLFWMGLFGAAAGFGIGIDRLLDVGLAAARGGAGSLQLTQALLLCGGGALLLVSSHRALATGRRPSTWQIWTLVATVWAVIGLGLAA